MVLQRYGQKQTGTLFCCRCRPISRHRLLSVTQRALSVTQRHPARALRVTQRALSVTQRALSVTQQPRRSVENAARPPQTGLVIRSVLSLRVAPPVFAGIALVSTAVLLLGVVSLSLSQLRLSLSHRRGW
jgi:hypothetical protein